MTTTEKVIMWKWFVQGEATSYFPSQLVIVRENGSFAHAIALAPNTAEGVEDFTIYDSEASLYADYSPEPLIQFIGYYTREREEVEKADRERRLLTSPGS